MKGRTFESILIRFAKIEDLAIVEGDIVLGPSKEFENKANEDPESLDLGAAIVVGVGALWPSGVIPYEIDPNVPHPDRVTAAVDHWQEKTSLKFIKRKESNAPEHPDFINFRKSRGGCSSPVGRQGGKQDINLNSFCSTGAIIHEIGHSVGFYHEQSRMDRDKWIKVNYKNIDQREWYNFNQYVSERGEDIGPYNYDSIMHYGPFDFSMNGQPTIVAPEGKQIGQRGGLSELDIKAIESVYKKD